MECQKQDLIKAEIKSLADVQYKEFQENLCTTSNEMLGVRIPVLRNYAKKLLKEDKTENLLTIIDNQYYEEIMLQGMLIGLSKEKDIKKLQEQIKNFIPKIDNWAVCDTFCSGLKITKKYKSQMWKFIQKYLKSDKEFEIRFGTVMILDYYIEKEYLYQIFSIFDKIYEHPQTNQYYVQMAVAWALAECLTKFYEETKQYLKITKIDNFTYNKTIQKSVESFRITEIQKEELKKMKKFVKFIS